MLAFQKRTLLSVPQTVQVFLSTKGFMGFQDLSFFFCGSSIVLEIGLLLPCEWEQERSVVSANKRRACLGGILPLCIFSCFREAQSFPSAFPSHRGTSSKGLYEIKNCKRFIRHFSYCHLDLFLFNKSVLTPFRPHHLPAGSDLCVRCTPYSLWPND